MIKFHHEYTKYYDFAVPLHPKNLAMLLHPHWGFFCKYNKEFSFDDIIKHYHNEFLSSHYRNLGREILANRISALTFWKIVDTELKGYLELKDFLSLLEVKYLTPGNGFRCL